MPCFAVILSTGMTYADGYEIDWYTIDDGGVTWSTGGAYEQGGTIGQPDAGTSSGGTYQLTGGFWSASTCCGTDADSLDDEACTCDSCVNGFCVHDSTTYGNASCDAGGVIDLDDILCVITGFGNFEDCPNGDIVPCEPDGIIDLDDILAVIGAFGGDYDCECGQ